MSIQEYFLNEYFHYSLDSDLNLISTRHGGWVFLSNLEYKILKREKIDKNSELFKKLESVGIILTKESTKKTIQDLRKENNFLFAPTNYHVIDVTNKCNFKCVYCHPEAGPDKDEMDKDTAKKVLDFIFSIPLREGFQIVIEGGEPLLKWDLMKFIYQEVKNEARKRNLGFRFSFTTNLSLMTDKIAKELSEMNINPCVSIDGPKELHNKQRPYLNGEGSYNKVVYWFKRLKDDYKRRVNAIPVVTNISLEYGPKAIIDEYLMLGQNTVFLKPFRASGRALSSLRELYMKPEDFYNFWEEGIEYCLYLNKKGRKIRELNTIYFISNILFPNRKSMCHRRPCGAGFSILSYAPDGTINGCDATRNQGFLDLGNVNTDNYQTIRKNALPLLALTPDLIPICSTCPFIAYCGVCLADTFGRENDIYPKIPRSFSCKWQKMAFEYLFKKLSENKEDAKILRSWAE